MPPKRGGTKKGGGNQKPDSDDDWVPVDQFGNPMAVVDTSGWDQLKTFDQQKKQGGVKSKADNKRAQRAAQQRKEAQEEKAKRQNDPQTQQNRQSRRDSSQQRHMHDGSDSESRKNGHTYHNSDGAEVTSQRQRSVSASSRHPGSGQQGKQYDPIHRPHKDKEPKPLAPPKVYKPTSITLTSFESSDRSFDDSTAGSKPVTVRTIFAKMSPEEKEEQKKLTHLPLPTYSAVDGEFLAENITTLTPGYIPGQTQKKDENGGRFVMPLSPQYQRFNISFPKRPNIPNPRALTPQQYRDIEQRTFHKWLEAIYTQYKPGQLNNFEHNLYVWKQLWLCCESSDIVFIILDARNPLFHFNSHLYRYIVYELKKPFVLVLNKIDLIPIQVSLAFKSYLERTFPGVHVVLFSSYPSALHSFVLALQHHGEPGVNANGNEITMDSLLKHKIDVTSEDIAQHQRSVVSRLKMTNIIDTVGVDELLQLSLHLTRGHSYQSPAEIYQKTLAESAAIKKEQEDREKAKEKKELEKLEKQYNQSPEQSLSPPHPDEITQNDVKSRRILSEREQYKWSLKNKKQNARQAALQEHLKNFISHAERVENEIKQQKAEDSKLALAAGAPGGGLEEDMDDFSLGPAVAQTVTASAPTHSSSRAKSKSYFRDTDDIDNHTDVDGSDADLEDASDEEYGSGERKQKNTQKGKTREKGQKGENVPSRLARQRAAVASSRASSSSSDVPTDEVHVMSRFNQTAKLERMEPPQLAGGQKPPKIQKRDKKSEKLTKKYVKSLHVKDPFADEDEDNEDQHDASDKFSEEEEDDDEDDEDEDDEIDYDNLGNYFSELSEDELDALELKHMVQESPTLSAARTNSPLIGAKTKAKPVFDMQRVLQHIYSQEENSREANSKTKDSLRQFQRYQREAGLDSDPLEDEEEEQAEKERKMHKKQQPLTRAQLKQQEREHIQYVKSNRIKIGFVGHPNVGKSSVVNAISRKKTVSVSRQPGHTKYNQTIQINELISLIDCPGLIFPSLDGNKVSSTLFGLYPIPQLPVPVVVIYYLAQMIDLVAILDLHQFHPLRYLGGQDDELDPNDLLSPRTERQLIAEKQDDLLRKKEQAMAKTTSPKSPSEIMTMEDLLNMKLPNQGLKVNVNSNTNNNPEADGDNVEEQVGFGWTANSICEAFALKRGFMSGKGTPDPQRAAQQILYLIVDGKLQLYMLPPDTPETVAANVSEAAEAAEGQ